MKILTHDSLSEIGGINRRLREIVKYVKNLNNLTYEFVILKIDHEEKIIFEKNFHYYHIVPDKDITSQDPYAQINSSEDLRKRFLKISEVIEKIILSENPDIIFLMGTFFFPWAILQSAKKRNIPIVHLYVGSAVFELYSLDGNLNQHYLPLELEFTEFANYTIFNSQHAFETITKRLNMIPKKHAVIWNGVSDRFFQGKPIKKREGIGYIGRSDFVKNPQFLISINDYLKKSDMEIDFYLISNMSGSYFPYENFKIIPQTTDDDKLRTFYQSRIFLISKPVFETFGNVLVESIAAGIPGLVHFNTGAAEVYKELGLQQLIIDMNDADLVVLKTKQLLDSKMTILSATRSQLYKLCNWNLVIEKYLNILSESVK